MLYPQIVELFKHGSQKTWSTQNHSWQTQLEGWQEEADNSHIFLSHHIMQHYGM